MRSLNEIADDVAKIYQRSGKEAEKYLRKVRKLKKHCGLGFAVVYCWFYSVPQKWTQVEPKIFELGEQTNSFCMDNLLTMPHNKMAKILKHIIFRNEISYQLKNFCRAIKSEYSSWKRFVEALEDGSIFELFQKLRKYRNIRVTFKNLAAMKIIVGGADNLLILDRHVTQTLGMSKSKIIQCKTQEKSFRHLINWSQKINDELKSFRGISATKWSLAIWFNRSGISEKDLL